MLAVRSGTPARSLLLAFVASAVLAASAAAIRPDDVRAEACPGSGTSSSTDNCKVVELKKGESAPSGSNTMSTSINAGNGKVTGTTTGPGGTVTSGSSGSFSTSTSSDGNSTVVTDSTGKCTVYRKAGD